MSQLPKYGRCNIVLKINIQWPATEHRCAMPGPFSDPYPHIPESRMVAQSVPMICAQLCKPRNEQGSGNSELVTQRIQVFDRHLR